MERTLVDEHISDEALERYAMGRLQEPEAAELEEHILCCAACQEALEQTDEFIMAFRTAARRIQTEESAAPARSSLSWRAVKWLRTVKQLWPGTHTGMFLPAAAALAVAVTIIMAPESMREPGLETVRLESTRGAAGIATVAAGNRLHLTLDSRGLPELSSYKLELVDSAGRAVWTGSAKASGNGLSVTTDEAVQRGQLWLRVYGPGGELLREFGILAKAQ